MSGEIRELVLFPDPRLQQECAEIRVFDESVQQLADDMLVTMYANSGIGLAAPQIGEMVRLIVVDCSEERNGTKALILANPEIVSFSGKLSGVEGCLSFPGTQFSIDRAAEVTVQGEDATGGSRQLTATELWAVCIQHEMDHLEGVTLDLRASTQKAAN